MESRNCHEVVFAILFVIITIVLNISEDVEGKVQDKNQITFNGLKDIASIVEKKLSALHAKHTHMEKLNHRDDRLAEEKVNPESLARIMSNKISVLFKQKHKLLEDIVSSLENGTKYYKWKDKAKNDFSESILLNATTEEIYHNNTGIFDEVFGMKVNTSLTGIHFPVEVFEGYPEIINGLLWSSIVDKEFKKNLKSDQSLSWQFFASKDGFMRIYPAPTRWYIPPPYNPVDLFDAKRRPWYIESSVSPKDVLILIDRSGSVHGQTFSIMKFAVETLLSTLTENDFVNIAAFNESTHWISDIVNEDQEPEQGICTRYSDSLIQANNINKKTLIRDLHEIYDMGMSNYTDAINFAYEVFRERAQNNRGDRGSNCHRLLMLFTDGGTDWPDAVMKTLVNDSDTSDVRIFTYAIGPHPIPTAVLKRMSCMTGGNFTAIITSSGVRTKIQESYLDKLSDPVAQSDKHDLDYTSAYSSAMTGNLTMTMSLPVFNLSSSLGEDRKLVGVAGIDIPTQHLENISPRLSLGPMGYAFITNHNGFLALHPRLQAQSSYLEDPPHLDLLDVELNPLLLEAVRKNLIDQLEGYKQVNGNILLDIKHIGANQHLQYTYTPIEHSPFSLGILTLKDSKFYSVLYDGTLKTLNENTSLLAPWNFCGTQRYYGNATKLKVWISQDITCDIDLLRGLRWANDWSENLVKSWLQETPKGDDILGKAIFTRFGLSNIINSKIPSNPEYDIFSHIWRDPSKNPALKSAILRDELSIFPHAKGAFLSKPAFVNSLVAAAVGVNVSAAHLKSHLDSALEEYGIHDSPNIIFVDETAFIVSTTFNAELSGKFLGFYSPLLMDKLTEAGIFAYENVTDFFAVCDKPPPKKQVSAASTLEFFFSPVRLIASSLFRFITIVESLKYLSLIDFTMGAKEAKKEGVRHMKTTENCFVQHRIYYFTEKMKFSGNITCLGDSAQVIITRIKGINGALIYFDDNLASLKCESNLDLSTNYRDGKYSIIDPKLLACRPPRFRRRINECLTSEPDRCSGASHITPLAVILMFVLSFNYIHVKFTF